MYSNIFLPLHVPWCKEDAKWKQTQKIIQAKVRRLASQFLSKCTFKFSLYFISRLIPLLASLLSYFNFFFFCYIFFDIIFTPIREIERNDN